MSVSNLLVPQSITTLLLVAPTDVIQQPRTTYGMNANDKELRTCLMSAVGSPCQHKHDKIARAEVDHYYDLVVTLIYTSG